MRTGLTQDEVSIRMQEGLSNKMPQAPSRTIWEITRTHLFTTFNFLNAILAIAVLIAGSPKNALFVGVIITNTIVGLYQELRAKATLEKLSVLNVAKVDVIRDGREQSIAAEELVLDDLMILKPGDRIAADAVVQSDAMLEVDEAMLTGEADPVGKHEGNSILAGSYVVAGSGCAKITKVGSDTYAAKLAQEAKRFKRINSELQGAVNKLFKVIMWLVVPIGALLVFTQLMFTHGKWQEAVVAAVSGIVSMVPEGLVLLTSATFVIAIVKLAKHHTLVQELPATEVLARVDVLCLDKTGTITEGDLDLIEVRPLHGRTLEQVEHALSGVVHTLPCMNPTQQAIRDRYKQAPNVSVTHKIPFSSDKKWSGAAFESIGAWVVGAPEMILQEEYALIQDLVEQEAHKGRRVLLLAQVDEAAFAEDQLAHPQMAAILLIEDRIRKEAPKALRYFAQEGVTIKIISGDNPITVSAVAARAGVEGAEHYIDARTLPQDMELLQQAVDTYTVFGRVTPQQKKLLVQALQSKGHTVAMTGDGVNDVLALKEADCGIAMANGSDAAKAVSQLVLLSSDFSVLPRVVMEGRKIINNLEKVSVLFLSKTVYSVLLSIIFSCILMPYPIMPIHVTLIGSLMIGIPAFFLAMSPNKERVRPGFLKRVLRSAIANAVILAGVTLTMFLYASHSGLETSEARTLAVLVLGGSSLVVLTRIARPLNGLKIQLVIAMLTLFTAAFLTPFGSELFMLTTRTLSHTAPALALVALTWPMLSLSNRLVKRLV
ncbi:cation-translocating P-type ATPase [Paenibacillus aquistagni]|uniref:cation-translocating P-type ATPase n=1 Tax=Paenibacillus aquistagni TaxID=1852522 RepID=UPI00145AD95C|nr:cation-translocating P-type ATPase [Paenibacillus aquistagni]NMM52588.1 cation-translocating P-type ATPase [Paenibacillus aquistagni]